MGTANKTQMHLETIWGMNVVVLKKEVVVLLLIERVDKEAGNEYGSTHQSTKIQILVEVLSRD